MKCSDCTLINFWVVRTNLWQKKMKAVLFFLTLSILFVVSLGADSCQDDKEEIGECKVKYHVCTHYNSGWQYQAEATETESDESDKSDWNKSSDGAVEEATKGLFKKLDVHGYSDADCNCDYQSIDQATCHLRVYACFYFESKSDVEDGKVSYKCTAYDSEDHDNHASVDGYDDAEECGNDASIALFKKYPDTGAKCGYGDKPLLVNPMNVTQELQGKLHPYKGLVHNTKRTLQPPHYRAYGSTCTGPHEFCCEAPNGDPSNCPPSAYTSDCAAKNSCCCA